MTDVAKAAQCDASTVSLALRDDPRITEATRNRIKKIAAEMNYSVNPLIAAWVHARRASLSPPQHIPIAYLACHPPGFDWKQSIHFSTIYEGARSQLENHGFKLSVFELHEYERDFKRLNEVLQARNIQGIIVGPSTHHYRIEGFDWSKYAAAAIGYALDDPLLHRVSEDHYKGMKQLFEHCLHKGYRRIGLGIVRTHNDERYQRWLAAYLLEQHLSDLEPKLPIFQAQSDDWKEPALAWAREQKPNIVLTDDPDEWKDLNIPTMGFAISDFDHSDSQGIIENNREIGIGAADVIVGLLYRNERGAPHCRRTVLVDPEEGFV